MRWDRRWWVRTHPSSALLDPGGFCFGWPRPKVDFPPLGFAVSVKGTTPCSACELFKDCFDILGLANVLADPWSTFWKHRVCPETRNHKWVVLLNPIHTSPHLFPVKLQTSTWNLLSQLRWADLACCILKNTLGFVGTAAQSANHHSQHTPPALGGWSWAWNEDRKEKTPCRNHTR